MFINQLSVFLENKPGRLAELTAILKENAVDIRALSISDTKDFGILRLIVTDPALAESSLKAAGFTVSQTQVIAVEIPDQVGGLAAAMQTLYQAHISVDYMYAFLSRTDNTASVILRVGDNQKAVEALTAAGIKIWKDTDVHRI